MKRIIAHRGIFDNKEIPENSIPAFKKAIDEGIAIEIDVQLTKDNKLVVFHDCNLERMTKKNIVLQNVNYNEIKSIKLLDTNYCIPTLNEVLKLVDNRVLLDIEIKNTKRIDDTCNILMKELENYNNYIIKSFNPKIVRYIRKKYPCVIVGYLMTNNYKNKLYNFILPSKFIINYCKPNFLAINKKLLLKKKYIELSKKYPVMVWTIKDKKEILDDKLIYICNNLPFSQ